MLRAASMLQPPALSLRGQHHGSKVTPFWDVFERIIGNAYCHETNKEASHGPCASLYNPLV